MDPETTATNWKAKAGAVGRWVQDHPLTTTGAVCFLAGLILGGLIL